MTASKYATIPYDVLLQAGYNWDKLTGKESRTHPNWGNSLDIFVGYKVHDSRWHNDDDRTKKVRVPVHAVDKFYMLASPHFRALIKAYEIKTGTTVYTPEQHIEQSS